MSEPKHPKQLMPEVLPAPRPNRPGSPRARTVGQMQRLLALAATGASVSACAKTPPKTDAGAIEVPAQPPASGDTKGEGDPDMPPRSDPSAKEPIPPPEPPTGYAVVDPMPPPARCMGLAGTISVGITWKGRLMTVTLGKPKQSGAKYEASEPPSVSAGQLKKHTIKPDSVTLEIDVPPGTRMVFASVAVSCPAGNQHVSLEIGSPSGPVAPGSTRVNATDSW
ncbi:MAG: hypothetical protein KC492_43030 [Myxococcales bacterium]|nr:hypothetical protein [Myxococcales bacterium]